MASSSRWMNDAEEENNRRGPNWVDLPIELTIKILKNLDAMEILRGARQVCSLWRNIYKDPLMWRTIHMSNRYVTPWKTYKNIYRYAIDLSCGHLEDYSIEYFGSNALLKYIVNSTSKLRRLRFVSCEGLSDKGLIEVANKLQLLEELDISGSYVSEKSVEAIGQCCPNLIALTFNRHLQGSFQNDDYEAFVIAKTMPKLRHLHLWGNKLTNDGLLAILDGCHHLESLDIRFCFFVDLGGSLGQRCKKQIKNLLYLPESPYQHHHHHVYPYIFYSNYYSYVDGYDE